MIRLETAWYLTYSDGRLCRPGAPRFSTCEEALEYANASVAQGRAVVIWHGVERAAVVTPRAWGEA